MDALEWPPFFSAPRRGALVAISKLSEAGKSGKCDCDVQSIRANNLRESTAGIHRVQANQQQDEARVQRKCADVGSNDHK